MRQTEQGWEGGEGKGMRRGWAEGDIRDAEGRGDEKGLAERGGWGWGLIIRGRHK